MRATPLGTRAEQRVALILHAVEGMSAREVGVVCGSSRPLDESLIAADYSSEIDWW